MISSIRGDSVLQSYWLHCARHGAPPAFAFPCICEYARRFLDCAISTFLRQLSRLLCSVKLSMIRDLMSIIRRVAVMLAKYAPANLLHENWHDIVKEYTVQRNSVAKDSLFLMAGADPSVADSPSSTPNSSPSSMPLSDPSFVPSSSPSSTPSSSPSSMPSSDPSFVPSNSPSSMPSSSDPSFVPSSGPSSMPSSEPSSVPSLVSSVVGA